ncbi:MAG TPA: hypothetical protein VFC19_24535 [Candidatus Limnocylindrales bacterium]|nr:hypothetical protein [Candidatus Limnocylindrales bacterium]
MYKRYFIVLAIIVAVLFAAVGFGNAALNPYVYDKDEIARVGKGLAEGKNLANYDPNVDLRAVRKAQIEAMTTTPDIVIFGGSRWQEARSEIIPGGHRVYNAFVSNDQIEDMMALAQILDVNNRLPKAVVYSLRFVSLQPVADRGTYDWKDWGPEYVEMSRKLGVEPVNYPTRAPVQQWSGRFYLPALWDRVQQVSLAKHEPMLTTESETETLDIIASDGSLHWSKASKAKFTRKLVDNIVEHELRRQGPTQPKIGTREVDLLGKLIDWYKAKGVKVYIIQSPYHPFYWQEIQKYPFGKTLHGNEKIALQMQAEHGAFAFNHYDPAPFPNCVPEHFVDHIHPTWECMQDMFNALPDLVTGVRR